MTDPAVEIPPTHDASTSGATSGSGSGVVSPPGDSGQQSAPTDASCDPTRPTDATSGTQPTADASRATDPSRDSSQTTDASGDASRAGDVAAPSIDAGPPPPPDASGADAANLPNVTLWIGGDSTVQTYVAGNALGSNGSNLEGWGQEIAQFFTSQVTVQNQAIGGRSVADFIYSVVRDTAGAFECIDDAGDPNYEVDGGATGSTRRSGQRSRRAFAPAIFCSSSSEPTTRPTPVRVSSRLETSRSTTASWPTRPAQRAQRRSS